MKTKKLVSLILIALAALSGTACKKKKGGYPSPTPIPSPSASPTPYGSGNVEIGINTHLIANTRLDDAKALGAKYVRIDIPWCQIEKRNPPLNPQYYEFANVDAAVTKAQSLGLKIYATIACTPSFSVREGQPAGTGVPKLADWENFIEVVAARYKGKIQVYGIWQEPNMATNFSGTARDYSEVLLKPAALIIREEASGTLVAGPDLARNTESKIPELDFLREIVQSGAVSSLDVLSYHAYGETDFKSNLDIIVQLLAQAQLTKDLWITEFGSDDVTIGEAGQAERLTGMIRTLAKNENVKKAFLYELDDNHPENVRYGVLRANGAKKPSFDAVKNVLAEKAPVESSSSKRH